MKKSLIAILCIVVIIAVIFVIKNNADDTAPATSDTSYTDEEHEQDNTPELQNGTKNPEKLIKITMPLAYFDAQTQGDASGFFNKTNYVSCKVDEKQKTFTVTIKSITHDFLLSNVGIQVIKSLGEMLDNGDYPCLVGFGKYNSDFSEIEFLVDGEKYAKETKKQQMLEFIGSCGIYYQLYTTENSYKCKVTITDSSSGEKLDSYTVSHSNKSFSS